MAKPLYMVLGEGVSRRVFVEAGDMIDLHSHSEQTLHTSEIEQGRFRVTQGDRVFTARPGDILNDLQAGEPHSFLALDDYAMLINRQVGPSGEP